MSATYSAPRRVDRGWMRTETGDDGLSVNVFITGPGDETYGGPSPAYNQHCSCCWLHFAHSADVHRARLLHSQENARKYAAQLEHLNRAHPGYYTREIEQTRSALHSIEGALS